MKKYILILISMILMTAISCKKKTIDVEKNTVLIKSYIQFSSVSSDSLFYTVHYNTNKKIDKIISEGFNLFQSGITTIIQQNDSIFFNINTQNGYPDTSVYLINSSKRVEKIYHLYHDYIFTYNNNGYLLKITDNLSGVYHDSIYYADFSYDASNRLTQINEYKFSRIDSQWNKRIIDIENTSFPFPEIAHSSLAIGKANVFSNSRSELSALLYVYQTLDIPYNFGNRQQYLPKKFKQMNPINTWDTYEDNFTYSFDSKNRVNLVLDSTSNSSVIKEIIIY